jgi:hypothetical protein
LGHNRARSAKRSRAATRFAYAGTDAAESGSAMRAASATGELERLQRATGKGRWSLRAETRAQIVPSPHHYKPGTALCSLTLGGKFLLFTEDTFDPITFLSVGFNAGIAQAQNSDPSFGQGAAGYGKRFAAKFVYQASSEFFKGVVYSEIFKEDPRYYRLSSGGTNRRLFHALEHCVVARRENGAMTFNFSEWLGTTSALALANTYHPGLERGVGPAAGRITFAIAQDAGYDVLREFWPEIAQKFKLPFRDHQ